MYSKIYSNFSHNNQELEILGENAFWKILSWFLRGKLMITPPLSLGIMQQTRLRNKKSAPFDSQCRSELKLCISEYMEELKKR